MSEPYDPVESLRREVRRFQATNTFTAMEVTGFYLQCVCVLNEIDLLRKLVAEMTAARFGEANMIANHCGNGLVVTTEQALYQIAN